MEISSIENSNFHIQIKDLNICTTHRKTQTLSVLHGLLLKDYGCVEWTSESDRVSAPLAVSITLPFVQPSVGSRNSPPAIYCDASQLRMFFQSTHEDRQGAEALVEPGERIVK